MRLLSHRGPGPGRKKREVRVGTSGVDQNTEISGRSETMKLYIYVSGPETDSGSKLIG